MFFQFNPFDTKWGPMHWGHAVSNDLVNWNELPIALFPDSNGTAFSGCAVIDTENCSGLCDNETAVILLYTRDCPEGQKQCLSYSYDCRTFHSYKNNPIIPNPGIKDFRDPKVIFHSASSQWIMVLAVKTEIWFYTSRNLLDWELTSKFHDESLNRSICFECPDLFPLIDTNGVERWILTISMVFSEHSKYNVVSYIGDFDGITFTPSGPYQLLDYGCDYYAAASFWGTQEHTMIGWFSNWSYADKFPTNDYCGIMSLPRVPSLRIIDGMPKVVCQAHPILKNYFTKGDIIASGSLLLSETLFMDIQGSGDFSLKFENKIGEYLEIGLKRNNYYIDRSHSGSPDSVPWNLSSDMEYAFCPCYTDSKFHLELYFDCCCTELFCDGGYPCFSMACFPTVPYTRVTWTGDITVSIATLLENIDITSAALVK